MRRDEKKFCPIMSINGEKECLKDKCSWWLLGPGGVTIEGYIGDCLFVNLQHDLGQITSDLKHRRIAGRG